jgi:NADH:ubiquinone oxidoreductase subunit 5 (subunit L)/multisubunit Na+/H+ antiporter MnhA subunit
VTSCAGVSPARSSAGSPAGAAHLLGALGAAAVLWGSVNALRVGPVKLLVAHSTVAQLGFMFLAVGGGVGARELDRGRVVVQPGEVEVEGGDGVEDQTGQQAGTVGVEQPSQHPSDAVVVECGDVVASQPDHGRVDLVQAVNRDRSASPLAPDGPELPVDGALEAIFGETVLAAVLLIVVGLTLIFSCLYAITRNMRVVVAGPAERSLNRVLGRAGYLGIAVGLVLTVSVQSSSIATSLLIPMIAAGVLSIPNAYPLTLGANLGTTVTALLAALAVERIEGLQIALVHLTFNTFGVALFYPISWLRQLPLRAAAWVADRAVRRRIAVFAYIILSFYVLPRAGILVFR